jgi:hypothetical protein
VLYSKLSYNNQGSSITSPAHWAGGTRARKIGIATKNSVQPSEDWAECEKFCRAWAFCQSEAEAEFFLFKKCSRFVE